MFLSTLKQLYFLALLPTGWCKEILPNLVPSSEMLNTEEGRQKVPEEKLLNPAPSGRYTVREEIQKATEETNFCGLTRTSVKISFPEMKSETYVNFLGYSFKEPNIVHLMRCKGMCGENKTTMSCMPTSVREKKVKMTVFKIDCF